MQCKLINIQPAWLTCCLWTRRTKSHAPQGLSRPGSCIGIVVQEPNEDAEAEDDQFRNSSLLHLHTSRWHVLLYTRSLPPSSCTVVLQNSIEQLTLHRRSMNRYSYLASSLARNNLHNVPRNYPTTNHLNEIVFRQPIGGLSCARFWHLAPSRTQFC
jgi:hypothetical protein